MNSSTEVFLDKLGAVSSSFGLADLYLTLIAVATSIALAKLPRVITNIQMYVTYWRGHSAFCVDAGKGKYDLFEDPFAWSKTFWVLTHPAIKFFFASTEGINHRAGFDWFHYVGWGIPTMDPKYSATVRKADQTVHIHLMKAKLTQVLEVVQDVGVDELARVQAAIGPDGKHISLHSLLYRIAYNVNCRALFGPDMDLVKTRVALQQFMSDADMLVASYGWPLPLWVSRRFIPSVRACDKAKDDMHALLVSWDKAGGSNNSSVEIQAILAVFEQAGTSIEIRSTFTNMMMTAFLANTPEALGWLFTNLVQAPLLLAKVREECDALEEGDIISVDFKKRTPHLYSAMFESFRMYVMMGTSAIVKSPIRLPGISHTFQPGTVLKAMGPSAAMSVENYGEDVALWKGHRFVGSGENMLQYDLTFSTGRSPCPGKAFAVAELCMLAASLVRDFDFSDFSVVKHLPHFADDFEVLGPAKAGVLQIVDLDGTTRDILHPGNLSDTGPPGMTGANIPINDFACLLRPRKAT